MSSSTILVTGACGFIGSHLVETLVRLGFSVKAMAEYNSRGSWGWLEDVDADVKGEFEVVIGDVRDLNFMMDAAAGAEGIFHLAALVAIPYSYTAFYSYVDTNVTGTVNVLNAALKNDIRSLIHVSTSETYGTAQYVPIDEMHPSVGQSPYSASKIGADAMVEAFGRSFGLPVKIVRPFNTFGPRQSARAIIPTVITQLLSGQETIKLGHLHPTRDFTYVQDTVSGLIAAYQSERGLGEVVNLGTGFEISIADLVDILKVICAAENTEIVTEAKRMRPIESEVDRLVSDNTKASQLYGWRPEFSDYEGIKKSLTETVQWFKKPHNLARYKPNIFAV